MALKIEFNCTKPVKLYVYIYAIINEKKKKNFLKVLQLLIYCIDS